MDGWPRWALSALMVSPWAVLAHLRESLLCGLFGGKVCDR